MRLILLLFAIGFGTFVVVPAQAGSAGGTPSPFMPPFPDTGCDARCIVRHEAELHCRAMAGRHLDWFYLGWLGPANVSIRCSNLQHKLGLLAPRFEN